MKKLLILGAGGHGKVVLDLALTCDKWDEISFLDDSNLGKHILGYEVIGYFEDFEKFKINYTHAIVALGNNEIRLRLTNELAICGYEVPTFIHPSAVVSIFSSIDYGTIVMPHAVINANSTVGKGCIINTGCIIEHDCKINNGVHLSPGTVLGGNVNIGELTWVCLGAKIINNIMIGSNVIIGAGSVVINDIDNNQKVIGVPGKCKTLSVNNSMCGEL